MSRHLRFFSNKSFTAGSRPNGSLQKIQLALNYLTHVEVERPFSSCIVRKFSSTSKIKPFYPPSNHAAPIPQLVPQLAMQPQPTKQADAPHDGGPNEMRQCTCKLVCE